MTRGAGRPTHGYYAADGTRLPSVTTVLGRFKDAGGLIHAAKKNWHEAGRRGLPFERDAYWGKPDSWGVDALQAGSIVHDWIEAYLHDEQMWMAREDDPNLTTDPTQLAAGAGFKAFLAWARLVDLEVLETETPLISEQYGYGGTLDCLARIGGEVAILDWKTSDRVYDDYKIQLAAYRELLRERDGDAAPKVAYLLQVSKESGDFSFHRWGEQTLDWGWRQFEFYLGAYANEKAA